MCPTGRGGTLEVWIVTHDWESHRILKSGVHDGVGEKMSQLQDLVAFFVQAGLRLLHALGSQELWGSCGVPSVLPSSAKSGWLDAVSVSSRCDTFE